MAGKVASLRRFASTGPSRQTGRCEETREGVVLSEERPQAGARDHRARDASDRLRALSGQGDHGRRGRGVCRHIPRRSFSTGSGRTLSERRRALARSSYESHRQRPLGGRGPPLLGGAAGLHDRSLDRSLRYLEARPGEARGRQAGGLAGARRRRAPHRSASASRPCGRTGHPRRFAPPDPRIFGGGS